MFTFILTGAESAERLATRLAAAAVRLAIGAEATQVALAHTVEGLLTPLVREEAPVDTGALRAGLRAQVTRAGGELVVTWHSDVDYAGYVEYGTGIFHVPDAHMAWDGHQGQHPNPFAERAADRGQEPIRAALGLASERLAVSFLADFAGLGQGG